MLLVAMFASFRIVEESKREPARWQRRYAGQLRKEKIQLRLFALVREEPTSEGSRETAYSLTSPSPLLVLLTKPPFF
jgi:hypothetical protein